MTNEEVKELIEEIEISLVDGDNKVQFNNYKIIEIILEEKTLTLSLAEKLIKKSKKLKNMLKIIKEAGDYNELLEEETFYTLMIAYLKTTKNDAELIKIDETFFSPEVYTKKDENNLKYFYSDLRWTRRLTPEEEQEISKRASEGDEEARRTLVESNIPLAVSIAKMNHYKNMYLSLTDLIQEGCLGLIKAAEKYDYNKGYKYTTYATWWVMHKIKRSILDKSKTIRIPTRLAELNIKVQKYKNKSLKVNGYIPSDETIAEELEIPLSKIKKLNEVSSPKSLSSSVHSNSNEEKTELLDIIPYEKDDYDEIEHKMVEEKLVRFIYDSNLKEKEKQIIMYKYGLNGYPMLNNVQIGKIVGISHERVRQIHERALEKLFEDDNIRLLRDLEPIPEEEKQFVKERKKRKKRIIEISEPDEQKYA